MLIAKLKYVFVVYRDGKLKFIPLPILMQTKINVSVARNIL